MRSEVIGSVRSAVERRIYAPFSGLVTKLRGARTGAQSAALPAKQAEAKPRALEAWERELSPWLLGAVEYSERYGSLAAEARRWRMFGLVGLVVAALCALGAVALAQSTKIVPYVVQVDEHGYAVAIKPAEQASEVDERVLIASVTRWVRSMRTVLFDRIAQRQLIDETYAMLAPGSRATEKASEWFRSNNPLDAGTKRVDVSITRALRMGSSSRSLTVEWIERASEGSTFKQSRYSAFIETGLSPTRTLGAVMLNPLGIYVTDFSISQLQ